MSAAAEVVATYLVETYLPLDQAAEAIAGEQSTGTFVKVARETAELRERFAARVLSVEELPPTGNADLPGASGDERKRSAHVRIAFGLDNFGPSLPNLLAAVAGNLFELRQLAGIRLLDLDLPLAFAERYPGPQYGVRGTRELLDRPDGVLLGTIVKPSIGLPPEELRLLVRELAEAGIDFIKDDELMGNPPHSPLAERVAVVSEELGKVAARTGRRPMYAFNITDDLDRMAANHDLVRDAGGTCVMVCVNLVGFSGLAWLRERCSLPIHGHRAMTGLYTRAPQLGIDYVAWSKLARLAGADQLHTNGLSNKFYETDEEVLRSIAAVRTPFLGGYETLPVLSSGQTAGLAPETYRRTNTTDLLVLAGGGIHGHPGGASAGVTAMRAAWAAATSGTDLQDAAEQVPALREALDTFGAPQSSAQDGGRRG
ncbi:RuBisCO large subunit C-terminal-like domain-containing protein [Kribbella shirazensis]|uniref:Ribulose-bisphosphate carboxylase large chain n=1 Tax=Kribbella shirazensis TaxID=1105143 RepID=A0A7X6A0Z7_9ACTN|nr:RuBisCO large subunit C-terminal-like domain-containing protein [Kribbella shirazensis]NIK57722.1 ribulose-bisphosphate carboxylase large chain [Kribbella shirazensis]